MLIEEALEKSASATATLQANGPLPRQMTPARILVVEDDEVLARFLERMLRTEGFHPELAHTGNAALQQLCPEFDAVILDLNLPGMDGIAVLQSLRQKFTHLPVLVLTARQRSHSAVLSLESGADDCLTKPFSYVELLARLRVLLRRHPRGAAPTDHPGPLVLHPAELRVERSGRQIDFTRREFSLLEFLMRSPGVPVTRSVILKELWGEEPSAGSNVVDVYMKYVRDKIDLPGLPKLIHTIRGIGYVFREG